MWKGFNPLGGHFVWRRKPVITESSHRICQGLPGGLTAGTPIKMTGGQSFFHLFFSAREQAEHWVPLVILLFYGYTVLKSWTFSIVNHWVLHRHCDRLRNFLTLSFVIYCGQFWHFEGHFQILIANGFDILSQFRRKRKLILHRWVTNRVYPA